MTSLFEFASFFVTNRHEHSIYNPLSALYFQILKAGIFVALKFASSSKGYRKGGPIGKLVIIVKKAYNLVPIKSNETCNSFCKW